jgi:hypothetical protein
LILNIDEENHCYVNLTDIFDGDMEEERWTLTEENKQNDPKMKELLHMHDHF